MTYGVVDVFKQACSSVTTTSEISSEDEDSAEANECRVWYETVRDAVIGSAFWPEAKSTVRLGLLATRDQDLDWATGDPHSQWTYAYARPADMLRPRYLSGYAPFDMALLGDTRSIVTNQEEALLIYTRTQNNPELWDSALRLGIVHMLASKIARKLTGSRSKMLDNYNIAEETILNARAQAANQAMPGIMDFTPSSLQARGANVSSSSRYIYPYADYTFLGGGNSA